MAAHNATPSVKTRTSEVLTMLVVAELPLSGPDRRGDARVDDDGVQYVSQWVERERDFDGGIRIWERSGTNLDPIKKRN